MADRLTETVSQGDSAPCECFTFRVLLAPRDDGEGIPLPVVAEDFREVLADVCRKYGLAVKGYGPVGHADKGKNKKA